MAATNSIGIYSFVSLVGEPAQPAERIETLTFPGVDYQRFRRLGVESPPFTLTSTVNVADIDEGRLVLTNYAGLKDDGLQILIYRDHNFSTVDSLQVQVLDVQQVELSNVIQWCGSLDDTDKAKLVAQWSLAFKAV